MTYYTYGFGSENFYLTGISAVLNNNYFANGYKVDGLVVGAGSVTGEMAYWLRGSDVIEGSYFADNIAGYAGNDIVYG